MLCVSVYNSPTSDVVKPRVLVNESKVVKAKLAQLL